MGWKKWLGIAAAVTGTVVVAGVVMVSLLPKEFEVTRSEQIDAPAAIVWEHVAVLENHAAWSPWQAKDPTMVNTFTGPEGVGRTMTWVGDSSGEGSQAITALDPMNRVDTHLDFGDMGEAEAWLALDATSPTTTTVTWGLSGTNEGLLGGAISAMMDTFIGGDYEDGLSRLKMVAEGTPSQAPPAPEVTPASEVTPPTDAAPPRREVRRPSETTPPDNDPIAIPG